MSKYRTDSQIPSLPALRAHCVNDVFQRAVTAPPPESLSRRAILKRLALLVGGIMLLSEPVAFARDALRLYRRPRLFCFGTDYRRKLRLAQSLVKGFWSERPVGAEPRAVRTMSMKARNAAGTCRCPG